MPQRAHAEASLPPRDQTHINIVENRVYSGHGMGVKGGNEGKERQRGEQSREAETGHDHVERGGRGREYKRARKRLSERDESERR